MFRCPLCTALTTPEGARAHLAKWHNVSDEPRIDFLLSKGKEVRAYSKSVKGRARTQNIQASGKASRDESRSAERLPGLRFPLTSGATTNEAPAQPEDGQTANLEASCDWLMQSGRACSRTGPYPLGRNILCKQHFLMSRVD